jgi:hypothetical protein
MPGDESIISSFPHKTTFMMIGTRIINSYKADSSMLKEPTDLDLDDVVNDLDFDYYTEAYRPDQGLDINQRCDK